MKPIHNGQLGADRINFVVIPHKVNDLNETNSQHTILVYKWMLKVIAVSERFSNLEEK